MARFGRGLSSLPIVLVILAVMLLSGTGNGHLNQATKLPTSVARSQVTVDSRSVSAGPTNWTLLATNTAPSPRRDLATVYDPSDHVVLLFGGATTPLSGGDNVVGETWVFQNGVWVNLTSSLPVSPPARADPGFAYDPADGYVVMFGGIGNPGGTVALNDTWVFSDMRWTELVTPIAPPARRGPAAAWDPADGYIVLFGGGNFRNGTGFANDTWVFHGGAWTQVTTTGPIPAARNSAAMTYDSADGYILMYGGWNGNPLNDTWTYRAGTWTELNPARSPSPRLMGNADMVYDPALQTTVLFGGKYLGTFYNETWTFLAGSWTNLTPSLASSPAARHAEGLVYLPTDGVLLLFGGETFWPSTLNDTWLFGDLSSTTDFVRVSLIAAGPQNCFARFGDVTFPPNLTVAAARTTYGITAYPYGAPFEQWKVTGGLAVSSGQSTRPAASVAVTGSGTITALFTAFSAPGNLSAPAGQGPGPLFLGLGLGAIAGGLGVYFVLGPGRRAFPAGNRPPEPPG